ncbi:MAG: ribose 5-phosphate isomerase B [bacterium]
MVIALASDHRGYKQKEKIKAILERFGHTLRDFGTSSEASTDYPEFAFKAVEAVSRGDCERAILTCYTGIGMSIAANKVNGIRAALCYDDECIELSRAHNNANVLVLPAKLDFGERLPGMIQNWIELPFEGGRHQRRLEKVSRYESGK